MSRLRPHKHRGSLPARVAVAATLVLATAGWNAATLAAPVTDQIDAQRAQIRALEGELIQIDAQAGAAADAHAAARSRVAELEQSIRETTTRLKRARVGHRAAQQRLSDRLVALYAEEPPSFVEILMSSDSISSAVDAHAVLDRLRERDGRLVVSIKQAGERLARGRAELLASREEAARQLAEASARDAELRRLTSARRAVLDQARGSLRGLIAEEAGRRAQLAAIAQAERQAEADLAARASAPSGAPYSAGASSGGASLEAIAQCESGGNPRAVSPDGQYRGKYQFTPETWQAVGGTGDPASAPEAEQDQRAAMLYDQQGSSPWPICGS